MVTASLKDDLKSFRRSWVHHTGMQLATLTVLSATFTVVAFVLALSLNFQRLLANWGDGVRLSVYVKEGTSADQLRSLKDQLQKMPETDDLEFVAAETAVANFKTQMASYAPDLLTETDFDNPFPASFRLKVKNGVASEEEFQKLEQLASTIGALEGVEDVSYGQSWMRNYSSFVSALTASGGLMILILLAGSLLVVGNSVRASITARREEIAILELVGATSAMIRRPYVAEGFVMGALASIFAVSFNLIVYFWQKSLLSSNIALSKLVPSLTFLGPVGTLIFFITGAGLGALGAWLTIRKINDGWSASQGAEA